MASLVLPNSINYNEQLPSISPSTQNFTQVLQPVNGSIFTQNQQIFIDIPSRGFIDPQSIYIRYKATFTGTATAAAANQGVIGCPLYAPFSRVDTMINSQLIDTVADYNVVAHQWTNLFLGVNEKYGNQFGFGYNDTTQGVVTLDELDGREMGGLAATAVPFFVSGPLVCTKLTGCEKFIPAFATGGIRLMFTIDMLQNFVTSQMYSNLSTTSPFTITNFELVYDLIDFGPEVEASILAQPSIMIKTNGYNNSSVTLAAGANGSTTLVYNQRLASIRSAIVLPSGTIPGTNYFNGKFDSVDVTSGGYYSLNIGGVTYPQGGPLSFGLNKAGILSELRKATGNLYDWSKSMSINNFEFNYIDNPNPTSQLSQPGKCYIGFDLNKINSASKNMLNGTSSQNAPINVVLNIAGAGVLSAKNVYLVLNYDAILNIDPRTKMITINQ